MINMFSILNNKMYNFVKFNIFLAAVFSNINFGNFFLILSH